MENNENISLENTKHAGQAVEAASENNLNINDASSFEAAGMNATTNPDETPILPFSKILEASVHIGLSVNHWNPKMAPYVFQKKRKYCILNAQKILTSLQDAFNYLKQVASENGQILVVDTRNRHVQKWIRDNCNGMKNVHFVSQRWLGGTLTNLKTINNSIDKLNSLMALQSSPDFDRYTKKEQIEINKKVEKLLKFFGGIVNMKGLPSVLVVTDPVSGKNAVTEAGKLGIPVVALANTNADPEVINHIVPCNTHSPRSVVLMLSALLDAISIAHGEAPKVAFKKEEEIELFFFPKTKFVRKIVNHRSDRKRNW